MPDRPPSFNQKRPRARRPSRHALGYGYRWTKLRNAFIARHPVCCDPYGRHKDQVVPATQVDHIIPRSRGGTDDESNLQALCASCHSYKTVRYDGGFDNARQSG